MRIVRFALGERIVYGRVEGSPGDERVAVLVGDVLGGTGRPSDSESYRLGDLTLLPPTQPSKIVAVGRNYGEHASEMGTATSERPRVFLKPPSSLIGQGEAICYPQASEEVHYEAELAVVIGRQCRSVSPDEVFEYVCGYTCANDVTARDIQRAENLPSYAKSFDTFCPLGPWIENDINPTKVRVTCTVNGNVRQQGNTSDMLWSVPDLVAYISAAMTLLPGDIILTGTPAGVGPIQPGDEVAVTIDGIGTLTNPVVR